jgi:hypothetical protein
VIKEFLMADTDLSTKFEKISDKAKTALDQLRAASQRTRDQLAAEAASARDQATAAANQFKHKGDFACDRASSQWREIRGKWQIHVAKARASVHRDRGRFNAREAARSADMAHAYALDAIDFAQAAIEEAESAALDAMSLRADVDARRSWSRERSSSWHRERRARRAGVVDHRTRIAPR